MKIGDVVKYNQSYIDDSVTYSMEPMLTEYTLEAWRGVVIGAIQDQAIIDGNIPYFIAQSDLEVVIE